uniref:Zinc finger, NFX1-type containing 1 n=2 Tax=Nothobranchius kadleci TaxID=1051664 RepID=A0A1A8CEK6_NOTKA
MEEQSAGKAASHDDTIVGQKENGHGKRGGRQRRGGSHGNRVREVGRAQSVGTIPRVPNRQRGGGRGENRGGGADRQKGRNGSPGKKDNWRLRTAETGAGRGGHSDDRRRSRDERRNGAGPPRPHLGYKILEDLCKKEPSVVAITLSSNPDLQTLLNETPIRPDLVQLLCLVLGKAFTSRMDRGTLQHLAGVIKDSKFFHTSLLHYIGGMVSQSNPDRRAQYPQVLENILAILSEVLNIFPASSVNAVSMLLTLFQASINSLRALGVDIQPEMEEKVATLNDLIGHLQQRSRDGTLRTDRETYALLTAGDNQDDDQQDFRTIPLYPTPEEFHQDLRPFLRPNLTSKRYTNTHIYLDTHFRLLREDFVRPLREGIQQLLHSQLDMGRTGNPIKTKRFDDIRVYFDTQLVVPKCTQTGLAYIVQFDIKPLKFVRWQNSKRLLFGSLVCLSCDNFESFLFATVSDRDPKCLEKGQVQISFTEESRNKLVGIQMNSVFLMVETTAYFEAYRYVLEGLQKMDEQNLPFQKYIVECSTDVQPPAYLRIRGLYDLSSVAEPDYQKSMKPFHSLKPEAWPEMEKLGLDESQMRAFQLALTKELAIIQGPPGTGKTYVGLKIAKALLTNQGLWNTKADPAPMLVVCYTNHALDQFLEGIHKFLKHGIVRVGGRSSSEILKKFNLRELTHSADFRRSLPSHIRIAFNQIYKELCEAERDIQHQSVQLECSLKGILREHVLSRFMAERHWQSLNSPPRDDGFPVWNDRKFNMMMEWLGLGVASIQQREAENASPNEEEAVEREEDLIDIAEEADLIQAERMIDDNWMVGFRAGNDDKKKNEDNIKQIENKMLAMNLNKVHIQAEKSEEGWEIQREQRKKMKSKIRKELGKSSAMTEAEERHILDVWSLDLQDRWRLYRLWVSRYRIDLRTKAQVSEQTYQSAVDRLADVKRKENLHVLKNAMVIGMTTTGAAKFRNALQELCPRVVIVEEAAEVLEAHTITTLSEACQHLILIGDHQQLKPSATVYDLAKNFHLEMSMFERLVNMKVPFVRLNYQHRMRPEIACLLSPHIYSELENHPSVFEYDNIKGLSANLFFVEHKQREEEIKDGKSHQNIHEAEFVVALCRYLLHQDYKPEQITILTTYTGQLFCLRKLMPSSEFAGVKVHVVDKYQGEENDIVLLSLVRSNLQGKVGFLSIPNRVCVALSRAKKGLYCICNSEILSSVQLWSNIFHTLREKDQVGKALTLCCQNHPDRQAKASCAEDFKQAPEGGCTQPCQFRLDCGHVCPRVCHPSDPEHKKVKCRKNCEKILCKEGHKCTRLCYEDCPECRVKVEKVVPQCKHLQMVPCFQNPQTFICQEPCQKLLECGHPCDSVCGEPCTRKCIVKVILKLKCGHSQNGSCHYNAGKYQPECKTKCKHQLKCGHYCSGTCGKCYQGRFHSPCTYRCERLLVCSHKCMEPCTRHCPPCQRPCENCCKHSNCMKTCGEPCAPCVEPCEWQCPHQSCSKLCHEPCDRPPCNEPCEKTLECGHPCIGLCGDKCPSKCRICNEGEVTEIFFGTEDDPEARFIQLEDCIHFIESTAMDHYMRLDDNREGEVAVKLKECPKCKTPIRKNLRYGSHINRSLAEIEMVKKKIQEQQPDINKIRLTLQNEWQANFSICVEYVEKEYMGIEGKLNKTYLTTNDLRILENEIYFLTKVAKLLKAEQESMPFFDDKFRQRVTQFMSWLSGVSQKFTDQQVFNLQRELQRLTLLADLNVRCQTADKMGKLDKMQTEVQEIRHVLEISDQFTEQDQRIVEDAMKSLNEKFPLTGLGIDEDERKMIVSAMKMPLGHWHKCPNGHVYVITECGGAMQRRACPDCKATIGGENHRLDSGNQVATEMDGAQHSAWSEGNNLQNFGDLGF